MRLSRSNPVLFTLVEKTQLTPYDYNLLLQFKINFDNMKGEEIFSVINGTFQNIKCKISLSNYRIQIFPIEDDHYFSTSKLEICLGCIDVIEMGINFILLTCKDFREVKLMNCTETESFVKKINHFREMPFILYKSLRTTKSFEPVYILEKEFERQKLPSEYWQVFNNADFKYAPTYPLRFIIPKAMTEEELKDVFKFRSSQRIPALVYYNQNGASLTRCSQPKVGMLGSRSEQDEKMIKEIRESNPQNKKLQIVDCRAKISAWANSAKGAGTENIANYPNCELSFMDIGNIHTMRGSLSSLFDLVKKEIELNSYGQWFYGMGKTGWFDHIYLLLSASVKVVEMIDKSKMSVMIHCSDGWDRTPQICSLVQILLDPYFRTIEGFQILIEKDWISFGHKFKDRTNSEKSGFWYEHESSPIFLQFMDCVFQIFFQFSCAFEFNELYLISILDHLYSNRFTTFYENNEKAREEIFGVRDINRHSESLWKFLNSNKRRSSFVNNLYNPKDTSRVLYPKYIQSCLQFWRTYYMRFYISEYDISLDKSNIVTGEEKIEISKKSDKIDEKDFLFSFNLDSEKQTFLGTKLSLKPECVNVKYVVDYTTSESDPKELVPMVIEENLNNQETEINNNINNNNPNSYIGSVASSVYSGVCSGISYFWSKPKTIPLKDN